MSKKNAHYILKMLRDEMRAFDEKKKLREEKAKQRAKQEREINKAACARIEKVSTKEYNNLLSGMAEKSQKEQNRLWELDTDTLC